MYSASLYYFKISKAFSLFSKKFTSDLYYSTSAYEIHVFCFFRVTCYVFCMNEIDDDTRTYNGTNENASDGEGGHKLGIKF